MYPQLPIALNSVPACRPWAARRSPACGLCSPRSSSPRWRPAWCRRTPAPRRTEWMQFGIGGKFGIEKENRSNKRFLSFLQISLCKSFCKFDDLAAFFCRRETDVKAILHQTRTIVFTAQAFESSLRANSSEPTGCFNLRQVCKIGCFLENVTNYVFQERRVINASEIWFSSSLHEALVLRKVELPRPVVVEDVPEDVWWIFKGHSKLLWSFALHHYRCRILTSECATDPIGNSESDGKLKKCHYKRLSLYPMIFGIRPKNCHYNRIATITGVTVTDGDCIFFST